MNTTNHVRQRIGTLFVTLRIPSVVVKKTLQQDSAINSNVGWESRLTTVILLQTIPTVESACHLPWQGPPEQFPQLSGH